MHLHRKPDESIPARWRAACVDGVLHAAYAAALAAESAAHRCADRISHVRPVGRHRGLRPGGSRPHRRPHGGLPGVRARRRPTR